MTRLPRELAPWAPFLEAFPDEAVRTIWPWLPRLHMLLGPVDVRSERRSGETDGFDGLTRRGIYDRLVAGEWALLELLPDEFIRRAAMNEQLYLKPARKAPQEAKRSVMLFDAGPDQLGAPRLVHLALLIVMARRARDSRTSFAWGVLQDPAELREELAGEPISRLVEARTWDAPGPGHVERWAEALAPIRPDDLWIVGSPGLARMPGLEQASTIVVEEPLEVPASHLSVSVARPGNTPHRKARLELPPPAAAVRLLRASSYRGPALLPGDLGLPRPVQFSWDGRRLLTRGPNGGLVAHHVPNSVKEGPAGRTRYLAPGPSGSLLAVSRDKGKWVWLTLDEGRLFRHGREPGVPARRQDVPTEIRADDLTALSIVAPPDDARVSLLIPGCVVMVDDALRSCQVFADGRRSLVGIYGDRIAFVKPRTAFCVDNMDTHQGRSLLMVERPPGGPRRLVHGMYGEIAEHPFDLAGDGTFEMVNFTISVTDRMFGLNDAGRRWRFCRLNGNKAEMRFDLHQQAGSRVVGWIPPSGAQGGQWAGLLCWNEERGVVMSVDEKREAVVFNAFTPIRSCQYHPLRALLAMRTDTDLIVYSWLEGQELLRIQGGMT